jgi:hypothetical protein
VKRHRVVSIFKKRGIAYNGPVGNGAGFLKMKEIVTMVSRRGLALSVVLAGCLVSFGLAAQDAEFSRTVRQCQDNGFSYEACVKHAEKVLQSNDSFDRQYQDERRRKLQAQQERQRTTRAPRSPAAHRSR